jgi:hypothetical protein
VELRAENPGSEEVEDVRRIDDPFPVVIFCSESGGPLLVELVTELDIRGVDFRIVRGVAGDPGRATDAMYRHADRALYVICRDVDLDQRCAQRVEASLELRGLPTHEYLLTLTLRSGRVESVASMVAARAVELGRRTPEVEASPPPPPPSVEPLGDPGASTPSSPFEIDDSELLRLETPRPRAAKNLVFGLLGLALAGLMYAGVAESSEATPSVDVGAPESALATRTDEGKGARGDASEPDASPRGEADAGVAMDAERVVEDERRIALAVREHELRALDSILLDPQRSKRGSLQHGRGYCSSRLDGALGGWRLPTLAEVSAVVDAGLISQDYYWTETLGDSASAKQVVYDGKRRRIKRHSPSWRGARAVCVRDRHLASKR